MYVCLLEIADKCSEIRFSEKKATKPVLIEVLVIFTGRFFNGENCCWFRKTRIFELLNSVLLYIKFILHLMAFRRFTVRQGVVLLACE